MKRSVEQDECGATLVEAAMATPIVLLLVFGIIWGALTAYAYNTLDSGVRSGARAGSIAVNSPKADYEILQSMKSTVGDMDPSLIESIVVYHANSFEQAPPAVCTAAGATTSISNRCNVYKPSDFNRPAADFETGYWTGDNGYMPSSRATSRSATLNTLVGVYVRARPQSIGFIPTVTVERYKVLRLESTAF